MKNRSAYGSRPTICRQTNCWPTKSRYVYSGLNSVSDESSAYRGHPHERCPCADSCGATSSCGDFNEGPGQPCQWRRLHSEEHQKRNPRCVASHPRGRGWPSAQLDPLHCARTQLFFLRRNDDVTCMAALDGRWTTLINGNSDGHRTSPVAGQPIYISDALAKNRHQVRRRFSLNNGV